MKKQVKYHPLTRDLLTTLVGKEKNEALLIMTRHAISLERDALRWKVAKEVHDIGAAEIDSWIAYH